MYGGIQCCGRVIVIIVHGSGNLQRQEPAIEDSKSCPVSDERIRRIRACDKQQMVVFRQSRDWAQDVRAILELFVREGATQCGDWASVKYRQLAWLTSCKWISDSPPKWVDQPFSPCWLPFHHGWSWNRFWEGTIVK